MQYERILIVDDSATSRMIIRRCCEIAGLSESRYFEAEDALKAVSFLEDNEVDLILSDLKMPKMDGDTFIKKLKMRESTRDIPVIVVSSMGSNVTEKQLLENGVRAVVCKPVTPEKFLTALGGAL
jgi:CheY-like chemotaxis protein